jgi:glycine cleavage system H protein
VNPSDRRYGKEHEWAKVEGDAVVVGITDYAQDQLGDVVYVELPKVGDRVAQSQIFGVIESVKTASDLFSPVSGAVIELNQSMADDPAQVNDSPYGDGWLIKVKPDDDATLQCELGALLDAAAYAEEIA